MTNGGGRLWLNLACVLICASICGMSRAEARTDYLIKMLESGRNYRLKVQAATTLGRLRSKAATPALARALDDRNDLVVISAANALGQIGDPTVISAIKAKLKKKPSTAVTSQLQSTLRVLEALLADEKGTLAPSDKPRYLVRVDPMGNSSGVQHEAITDKLFENVMTRLRREPGVVLQGEGLSPKAVKKRLKKEKLGGYILSGAVLTIGRVENRVTVKIGLNVFTNPDYKLLMMPTAQATAAIESMARPGASKEDIRASELKTRERVMRSIVNSLVTSVFDEINRQKDL